jgi:hypothetical protein
MGLQPSLMQPYIEFMFKCISGAASQMAYEKAKFEGEAPEIKERDKRWDIWEWPLRVFQFGAQGSCSLQEKFTPGKIITVIASLFVGSEIDRNGNVWSVISLCTPGGIYDFVRHKIGYMEDVIRIYEDYNKRNSESKLEDKFHHWKRDEFLALLDVKSLAKRIETAQSIAARIFQTQSKTDYHGILKLEKGNIFRDPNNPYEDKESEIKEGDTLKQTVEKIYDVYKEGYPQDGSPPGAVTLTVSYFGGEEDKDASDELGIYSVGMEDYHVLRILRTAFCQGISSSTDYPIVVGWRIDRIQCDPKTIEKEVQDAFLEYIKNKDTGGEEPHALLTADQYADIIVWGLQGLITTTIPACTRWNFAKHYWGEGEEWQKRLMSHFWSFTYTGEGSEFTVPNPFHIEIATDFLKDLMEKENAIAGMAGLKDNEGNDAVEKIQSLAKAVENAWKGEEKNRGGYQKKKGSERDQESFKVSEKSYIGPSGRNTKAEAKKLIEYIGKLKRGDGEFLFYSGIGEGDGKLYKTWLRTGGKWGSFTNPVKEATTQDLTDSSDPKFDGACVDRAFYKSCNMMALQTLSGYFGGAIQPMDQ